MASPGIQRARPSPSGLGFRILALVILFAAEASVATVLLDGAMPAPRDAWLTLLIHHRGAWAARCVIGFSALFATFAYARYGTELAPLSKAVASAPIRWRFVAGHFGAIGLFTVLSTLVYGGSISGTLSNLASAAWLVTLAAAIISAGFAVLPWNSWLEMTRVTGWLWAYAAGAAVAASSTYSTLRSLWGPTSRLTFSLVQLIARPFFGDMVIQPEALRIGTHRFTVVIADECSGLEGIGLLLVFGVIWLVLFKDDIRFPQALVLLPMGVAALFLLNAVRILGLIAIGNAGAKDIAMGGFHSQAGWLAFNSVAFGLCVAAREMPWISTRTRETRAAAVPHDSTAALLVPFLCILAAGMISRAVSGAFEWFYALRFVGALGALVLFRRRYATMEWKPGWVSLAAGAVVFAFWVALDHFNGAQHATPMPPALASATPAVRWSWIALRILGGVITVPIAEELAFRGYLLRRFISADFENVSPRKFTWLSLLASSVIFGLMHGGRWLAGTGAGVVYGLVLLRRGRIGDSVAAHASTNALLAGYVTVFRQWQLW